MIEAMVVDPSDPLPDESGITPIGKITSGGVFMSLAM
jgi:hypothetical protein